MVRVGVRRGPLRSGAVALAVAAMWTLFGSGFVTPASLASAVDPACSQLPAATAPIQDPSWTQPMYDAPEKLWPFSRGAGVTVAVLDTGVDADHPQLTGKVSAGFDEVRDYPEGDVDCGPHGTGIASVIAGARLSGIGTYGLAPDAMILPVRITDKPQLSPSNKGQSPQAMAAGITYAVAQGAQVVVVSAVLFGNYPLVEKAVKAAVAAGVVVVAAVGDAHDDALGVKPDPKNLTPYPAAYPGVIGVTAVDPTGLRVPKSQIGSYVDLAAPGSDIIAAGRGGQQVYAGTSIATAFVGAAAALLLAQKSSTLSGVTGADLVSEVSTRLFGTVSPGPGGPEDLQYGHGIVDPYRALTEGMSEASPEVMPGMTPAPVDAAAQKRAAERADTEKTTLILVGVLAAVVIAAIATAIILPRGRVRRWRPTRRTETASAGEDGPEFIPPDALFKPPDDLVDERR